MLGDSQPPKAAKPHPMTGGLDVVDVFFARWSCTSLGWSWVYILSNDDVFLNV